MDADLMGAAGFQVYFQQRCLAEGFKGVVVSDGVFAVGGHGESPACRGVPPDGCFDGSLQRIGVPLHECVVGFGDAAVPEGAFEHGVGAFGGCDHHHPGRTYVEPLYYAFAFGRP